MRTNRIALCWRVLLLSAMAVLTLAGCGGNQSGSAGAAATPPAPVPTMPPARFTAVAQQSALTQTVAITGTATSITATTTITETSTGPTGDQTSSASAADLERGARSYERNQCASCHGERGEGVAGKGQAITGAALSEREFEHLLRTGGGLGNTHIFGPSAVSPAGMGALYAYVQSLQQ